MFSLLVVVAISQSASEISGDDSIVNPQVVKASASLPKHNQISNWPPLSTAGSRFWSNSRLPDSLKKKATAWAERTLAAKLLPKDLYSRWKGIERFEESDVMCVKYSIQGRDVQIVDLDGAMAITVTLFDPENGNLFGNDKEHASRFLRGIIPSVKLFSKDKVARMEFYLNSKPVGGTYLFYGSMGCEMQTSSELNSWWSSMTVLTNGGFISLLFTQKLPGPPAELGAQGPGYYLRFRNG